MRLAHELDVLTAICTEIKNGEGGGVGGGKDVKKAGMPDFNCSTGFREQNWDLRSVKLQVYKNLEVLAPGSVVSSSLIPAAPKTHS